MRSVKTTSKNSRQARTSFSNTTIFREAADKKAEDHRALIKKGYVKYVQVQIGDELEKQLIGMIPMCSRCGLQLLGDNLELTVVGMEKMHVICPPAEEIARRMAADIRRVLLGFAENDTHKRLRQ